MDEHSHYPLDMWKIFSCNLFDAFIRLGFEVIENPYYDRALDGFRATYVRRYVLHNQTIDGSLVTIIHLVGLPFGNRSQKMVVLASPRDVDNEPVCNTLKLRIHIDDDGYYHIVQGDQPSNININGTQINKNSGLVQQYYRNAKNQQNSIPEVHLDMELANLNYDQIDRWHQAHVEKKCILGLTRGLINYVYHIIEMISPGLIELPTDMKMEILKRLSIASIIRMSQVNNEFRSLIFLHGESLWRHLCMRDFNIRIINRKRHTTWFELYKEAYFVRQVEICRKERALPGLPDRPALPPAPDILQIEWWPGALQLAFMPVEGDIIDDNGIPLAIQLPPPIPRAESLDSLL